MAGPTATRHLAQSHRSAKAQLRVRCRGQEEVKPTASAGGSARPFEVLDALPSDGMVVGACDTCVPATLYGTAQKRSRQVANVEQKSKFE